MKTKKFNRKLDLNKKTIANLNVKEMNNAAGGVSGTAACFTFIVDTCGLDSCGPGDSNCLSYKGLVCICEDPH